MFNPRSLAINLKVAHFFFILLQLQKLVHEQNEDNGSYQACR